MLGDLDRVDNEISGKKVESQFLHWESITSNKYDSCSAEVETAKDFLAAIPEECKSED